jgi:hypothetical protein
MGTFLSSGSTEGSGRRKTKPARPLLMRSEQVVMGWMLEALKRVFLDLAKSLFGEVALAADLPERQGLRPPRTANVILFLTVDRCA